MSSCWVSSAPRLDRRSSGALGVVHEHAVEGPLELSGDHSRATVDDAPQQRPGGTRNGNERHDDGERGQPWQERTRDAKASQQVHGGHLSCIGQDELCAPEASRASAESDGAKKYSPAVTLTTSGPSANWWTLAPWWSASLSP